MLNEQTLATSAKPPTIQDVYAAELKELGLTFNPSTNLNSEVAIQ